MFGQGENHLKWLNCFEANWKNNVSKDVTYVGNHTTTHLTADITVQGLVLHNNYMHDARWFSSWICFEALERPTECFWWCFRKGHNIFLGSWTNALHNYIFPLCISVISHCPRAKFIHVVGKINCLKAAVVPGTTFVHLEWMESKRKSRTRMHMRLHLFI